MKNSQSFRFKTDSEALKTYLFQTFSGDQKNHYIQLLDHLENSHYQAQHMLINNALSGCFNKDEDMLDLFNQLLIHKKNTSIHHSKSAICFESIWILFGSGLLALTAALPSGPGLILASILILSYTLIDSGKNIKELMESVDKNQNKKYSTLRVIAALVALLVAALFIINPSPLFGKIALYGGLAALGVVSVISLNILIRYFINRHHAVNLTNELIANTILIDTSAQETLFPESISSMQLEHSDDLLEKSTKAQGFEASQDNKPISTDDIKDVPQSIDSDESEGDSEGKAEGEAAGEAEDEGKAEGEAEDEAEGEAEDEAEGEAEGEGSPHI